MTDAHVDGNALGGVLADVFGRDLTAAIGTCGGCGKKGPIGSAIAYVGGPGDVLRCPACGTVLLVAVHVGGGYRVTLEALRTLEVAAVEN
jgi:hypothetical protein